MIFAFGFGDEPVNSGDTISVQCTVSKGDYPLNITWFLNGRELRSGDGISISRNSRRVSSLTVDSVYEMHAGAYKCEASNFAGTASHTAVLKVNGTCLK